MVPPRITAPKKKPRLRTALGKFQDILDKSYVRYQFKKQRIETFRPRIPLVIESNRFLIKTASSFEELEKALRLRFDVFLKEGLKKKRPIHVDIDRFDFHCDHLLIIEKESERVVGTYRLLSSLFTREFYSESEFDLGLLLSLPGVKLELGRACIDRDFRSGIIMTLLWRGLADYMKATETRFLFGCSSMKTTNVKEAAEVYAYFESKNQTTGEYGIRPMKKFIFPKFEETLQAVETIETLDAALEKSIPPLLHTYLKAGARIAGFPALDQDFKCTDFLTVLDTEQIHETFGRKFLAKDKE